MTTNDGGPAFPSHGSMGEVTHEGMSLRDWFAGQSLAGLLSDPTLDRSCKAFARDAYGFADAMLAARAGAK